MTPYRRRRLLVGDAGLALQCLAGLALERANPGRVLGQFGDQRLGHADVLGWLSLDRHVPAERALGRRIERAIDLGRHTAEPDQLRLGRTYQLR